MSEYWVSHKKYFCKYCNIYIADDKPSRTQHESGLRHKGNVERFVRGLYKAGEKRKQDLEEEKREMARIERSAAAAYAQDVGAGLVKPGSSSAAAAKSAEAGPSKPRQSTDQWANYTTAASLGITDPDAERQKAEAERRRQEGVAGAWEVVAIEEPVPTAEDDEDAPEGEAAEGDAPVDEAPIQQPPTLKREAEAPPDDEDARAFKFRRKKLGVGLGEIYDPGVIPIKLKAKKKEESAEPAVKEESSSTGAPAAPLKLAQAVPIKGGWSAGGWSGPKEAKDEEVVPPAANEASGTPETQASNDEQAPQPTESSERPTVNAQEPSVKAEPKSEVVESPISMQPSSLFRKRKVPAGGTAGRGRR